MDPLTALLAAAAATGPNTLQSQALTALRSAGPQESFFTRMGNPHPLQVQQLAQPAPPQLTPTSQQWHQWHQRPSHSRFQYQRCQWHPPWLIRQPGHFTYPRCRPSIGCSSRPAQHQFWCQQCPSFRLYSQPLRCQETRWSILRPTFLHSPHGSWPSWHSWRCRTSKHCAAAHTMFYSPACRQWQGDLYKTRHRAKHSPLAPQPTSWRQDKTHNSVHHRSPTQHHEGKDRRAVCHPRTGATPGHSIDATADPEATVVTAGHAAMVHAEPIDTDPGPLGPDPQAVTAVTGPSCYAASTGPAPDRGVDDQMELQGTSTTAHRNERRSKPILAAADGDESTFCVLHGLDPGDRSNTTTASIPIPAIQLHSGPQQHHQPTTCAEMSSVIHSDRGCPAHPHPDATFSPLAGILLGILSEDLVRQSAQDLKIEGTEQVQATAVYGSATPGPWSSRPSNPPSQSLLPRDGSTREILSKYQHYKCDFRDTRKEHAIVARRGVVRTPERWGFHADHLTIKGIAIFAP